MTPEEIAAVAVFAALGPRSASSCRALRPTSSSLPGEYAAHEGGERALFALLEGRIEAVKLVDGIERVVGERKPGDIFGEVPIVLGTVFPVGFRAAERSRIMRLEPHDYHAVAAVRPTSARRSASWRPPDRRAARAPGPRRRTAAAARDRRRQPLGSRLHRAASLPRPQPDHLPVAHTATSRTRPSSWGGAAAGRRGSARRFASSTGRPSCARSTAGSPSSSASATEPPPPSTTPWSSARARPGWRPPCTAPRRACARS